MARVARCPGAYPIAGAAKHAAVPSAGDLGCASGTNWGVEGGALHWRERRSFLFPSLCSLTALPGGSPPLVVVRGAPNQ